MFEVPRKFRIFRDTEDTSRNIMIARILRTSPQYPAGLIKKLHSVRLENCFPKSEAYLYSEGFCRFCSESFTLDPMHLSNACVHLTNNEATLGTWI